MSPMRSSWVVGTALEQPPDSDGGTCWVVFTGGEAVGGPGGCTMIAEHDGAAAPHMDCKGVRGRVCLLRAKPKGPP